MRTSSTSPGLNFERLSASLMQIAARSAAGVLIKLPPNFPIAVRTTDVIAMRIITPFLNHGGTENTEIHGDKNPQVHIIVLCAFAPLS
jgi:hypothetical protein